MIPTSIGPEHGLYKAMCAASTLWQHHPFQGLALAVRRIDDPDITLVKIKDVASGLYDTFQKNESGVWCALSIA